MKNPRLYLFITVSSLLVLQGCFEESVFPSCSSDCTTIKGRFVTEDGTVPVDGMELRLTWSAGSSNFLGIGDESRLIKKLKTNSNGDYNFEIYLKDKELPDGEIIITYKHSSEKYILVEGQNFISFGRIARRDTIIIKNYYLPTRTNLEIKVANPETIISKKSLTVFVEFWRTDRSSFGHMLALGDGYHNMKSDTVIAASANRYNYIRIQKNFGDNTYENKLDSVFAEKGVTNIYTVTF